MSARAVWTLGLVAVFIVLGGSDLAGQGIRLRGSSTAQFVQARPLVRDSVLASEVPGEGILRVAPGGGIVECALAATWCAFDGAGDPLWTVPTVHEISATAWGGLQGLRVEAQVLLREEAAGEKGLWPQADDRGDLVVLYAEWARPQWMVRAGRQWHVGGLGWRNFDGVTVEARPRDGLRVTGWVGWSLAPGLNEPRNGSLLAAVERRAPSDRSRIGGLEVVWRASRTAGMDLSWRREALGDRSGLVAEQLAAGGHAAIGAWRLNGRIAGDLALHEINDAWVDVGRPIGGGFTPTIRIRRSDPLFELWTIWGAFSPVGWWEGGGALNWAGQRGTRRAAFELMHRRYDDTGAQTTFFTPRSTGWRMEASAGTAVRPGLDLEGRFRVDVGFGSSRTSGAVRASWMSGDRWTLAGSLEAFQSDYEFRVQNGTVLGSAWDLSTRLSAALQLTARIAFYRHLHNTGAEGPDWTQSRARISMRWAMDWWNRSIPEAP